MLERLEFKPQLRHLQSHWVTGKAGHCISFLIAAITCPHQHSSWKTLQMYHLIIVYGGNLTCISAGLKSWHLQAGCTLFSGGCWGEASLSFERLPESLGPQPLPPQSQESYISLTMFPLSHLPSEHRGRRLSAFKDPGDYTGSTG